MYLLVEDGQIGHIFLLLKLGRIAFENLGLWQLQRLIWTYEYGHEHGRTNIDINVDKIFILTAGKSGEKNTRARAPCGENVGIR